MEKSGFTIIIPAYNEATSVVHVIAEIKKMSGNYEIIIVDDGSNDKTFELIENIGVKVFRHSKNNGYGASLKTGIKNAKYDIIVITDADGTYPNDKIPELVKTFENNNLDMVVGARIGKNVKIPLIRKPAKWCITKLACFLTSVKIPDLNSGLRVMRKDVVEKYIHLLPDGFSFTTTITLAMLSNNHSVEYVPIDYFKRNGEKSKIKPIQDTLNFIQLIIRMVLYFNPLRVFVPVALPLIIGGGFLIIFQGIYYHNITTTSVIVILSGVQLLAIGMLADLIDKKGKFHSVKTFPEVTVKAMRIAAKLLGVIHNNSFQMEQITQLIADSKSDKKLIAEDLAGLKQDFDGKTLEEKESVIEISEK